MALSNLILDSDYPIDKIVWLHEGTMNLSQGVNTLTIPHGVGAQIYPKGIWTVDDWATTQMFGVMRYGQGGLLDFTSQLSADSLNTDITLRYEIGSATAKIRLWGVCNDTQIPNLEVPNTAPLSNNNLVIDTRNNYPKLFLEGFATPNTTVNHNLGAIPQVDIWAFDSYSNQWYLFADDSFGTMFGLGEFVKLTASTLEFTNNSGASSNYYYRIYA